MNAEQIDQEREKQIKKLLDASTEEEKQAIEQGRRAGQRLRKEVERLLKNDSN